MMLNYPISYVPSASASWLKLLSPVNDQRADGPTAKRRN